MAKKKSAADEEIIDLTELIEAGIKEPPKKAAANAAAFDNDFEELLAQTDANDGRSAPKRPVNPNEELDMPGMGDIDNLLESLDMPPQPEIKEQASPEEDLGAGLDSVLDDLLGESAPAKPEPKPQSPPNAQEADPGALLNISKEAPVHSAQEAASDLDDFLSSLDEPASAPQKSAPAPAPESLETAVDADLDEILSSMEPPAPQPAPTLNAAPEEMQLPPDLDALLAEGTASAESDITPEPHGPSAGHTSPLQATSAAPQASYSPELVANLIAAQNLGSRDGMQDLSRQLGAQEANVANLTRQMEELSKRLFAAESKLSAARARIAALEKDVSAAAKVEDLLKSDSSLQSGFAALIAEAVRNAVESAGGLQKEDADLSAQVQALAAKIDAQPIPTDSLTEKLAVLADGGNNLAARLEEIEGRLNRIEAPDEELAERLESLTANGRDVAERLQALEAKSETQASPAPDLTEKLEGLADAGQALSARLEEIEGRLNRVETPDEELAERLESLTANGRDVAERLQALEARVEAQAEPDLTEKLEALENKIDNLTLPSEEALARLNNLGDEAAEAERIAALEQKLVESIPAPEVVEKLKTLTISSQSSAARMNLVEKRLDDLEPNFNKQIEKAAASAVARILQEEIKRLVQGDQE